MTSVFNPKTREIVDLEDDDISTAEAKGWKELAVVDPKSGEKHQMENIDEWFAALKKGYVTPAQHLEREKLVESDKPGLLESAASGASQGLTFGFADELAGGMGATFDLLSGRNPIEGYKRTRDIARRQYEAAQAAHPVVTTGAEIAAGIVPAFMAAPVGGATAASTATKSLGSRIAAMGTEGAIYGGVSGAGKAESIEDIPEEVVKGGLIGGGVGAGIPLVGAGVKTIGKGVLPALEYLSAPASASKRSELRKFTRGIEGGPSGKVLREAELNRDLVINKIIKSAEAGGGGKKASASNEELFANKLDEVGSFFEQNPEAAVHPETDIGRKEFENFATAHRAWKALNEGDKGLAGALPIGGKGVTGLAIGAATGGLPAMLFGSVIGGALTPRNIVRAVYTLDKLAELGGGKADWARSVRDRLLKTPPKTEAEAATILKDAPEEVVEVLKSTVPPTTSEPKFSGAGTGLSGEEFVELFSGPKKQLKSVEDLDPSLKGITERLFYPGKARRFESPDAPSSGIPPRGGAELDQMPIVSHTEFKEIKVDPVTGERTIVYGPRGEVKPTLVKGRDPFMRSPDAPSSGPVPTTPQEKAATIESISKELRSRMPAYDEELKATGKLSDATMDEIRNRATKMSELKMKFMGEDSWVVQDLDDKWHIVTAEVETGIPTAIAGKRGTNAVRTLEGKVLLPTEVKSKRTLDFLDEEMPEVATEIRSRMGGGSKELKPIGSPKSGKLMEAITDVKSGGKRPTPDIPGIEVNDKGEAILSVGGKSRVAYKRSEDGKWLKPDGKEANPTYSAVLEKQWRSKFDEGMEDLLRK